MNKFLLSMALALLGWVGLAQHASAATINPNPVAFVGGSGAANAHVNDVYEFSFSGVANGGFGALSVGLSNLNTSICDDAVCTNTLFSATTVSGPLGLFSLSLGAISNLLGGTYFFVVSGDASGFGGAYFGALALNVSPVPVPPALLLFVTALVGLGGANFFRRKSGLASTAA